jgi:RND family efflux transporter MFP subunit
MSIKRGYIFIPLVVVLVLLGVMVVKKRKAAILSAPTPSVPPIPVEVAKVRQGALEVSNRYLGTVEPMVSSNLAPRVTGHILEVRVREGDKVSSGEVLAVLDNRPFLTRYNSLKAQLEGAKSTFETLQGIYHRDLMLYKNKAISKERLDRSRAARDEVKAKVATLEESIKDAKLNLEYCQIRAPMDGVITKRLQEPGDLGLPGKAVLAMEAPQNGYKVVVHVPQRMVAKLKVGDRAVLYSGSPEGNQTLNATISRIYPAVTVGTLATVEVDLPNRPFGLPSGAVLDVALVSRRVRGMMVPLRALLHTTRGDQVFSLDSRNRVRVVPVQVLGKSETHAAISGPLTPGERVVTGNDSLLLRLHNGVPVAPKGGERL